MPSTPFRKTTPDSAFRPIPLQSRGMFDSNPPCRRICRFCQSPSHFLNWPWLSRKSGHLFIVAWRLNPRLLASHFPAPNKCFHTVLSTALVNELSKRRRGPATKTCDDTQRALHSAAIQESWLMNHPTSNSETYPTCKIFTPNKFDTVATVPIISKESWFLNHESSHL